MCKYSDIMYHSSYHDNLWSELFMDCENMENPEEEGHQAEAVHNARLCDSGWEES